MKTTTGRRASGKRRLLPTWLGVFAAVLLVPAAIAVASDVAMSVVDTTAPTGAVTLDAGQSGAVTIKATVSGKQEGTATFEVYRDWTLKNGSFEGSNPVQYSVRPREAGDPANIFTTSGTVHVASGQAEGSYTLAVGAFDITNTNTTGAKLSVGQSASYTVTVHRPATPPEPPQPPADATPPAFITMPADTVLEAGGPWGAGFSFSATANDATDGAVPVSFWLGSEQITSPHTFPLGSTTVTVKAADAAGNRSEATFTVRVTDTTAPELTIPVDVTLEATGPKTTVAMSGASATDLVDPSPAISYSENGTSLAGSAGFALGTHTITVTATDASGNSTSSQWHVTIVDTTAPSVTAPANLTSEATSGQGAKISLSGGTARDLVDGDLPVSYWANGQQLASPAQLPVGTTQITVRASDASGNSGSASYTVSIRYNTASGVAQPINYTGTQSWFKAGSTIPVKFSLPWSGGSISDATATLTVTRVSTNLGAVNETAVTLAASSGNLFRYDASASQYIYNLSTKTLTAGEYRLTIDLNGGQQISVRIGLR